MSTSFQPVMPVPGLVVSTVLGCCECDFKCGSANKMCQHMFDTHHCLIQCPECCVYLVPKAFYAGVMKLIERHRREMYAHMASHRMATTSTSNPAGMVSHAGKPAEVTETGNRASKLIRIECVAHSHTESNIHLIPFPKERFVLPGGPEDYGLQPTIKTDAGSMTIAAAHALSERNKQDPLSSERTMRFNQFRCMSCLTALPTWTQVTKHIDATEHTFPHCVGCDQCLKCYGPTRPWRHSCMHPNCGFVGTFYTRLDYMIENQAQQNMYNIRNDFTGLSTTQYKCVCGLTFIHLVHLAQHLRQAHQVSCIEDRAYCQTCKVELSLDEMTQHVRQPIMRSEETGKTGNCHDDDTIKPVHPNNNHANNNSSSNCSSVDVHAVINTKAATTNNSSACAREHMAHFSKQPISEEHLMIGNAKIVSVHRVEMNGFDGMAFLQHAPLLPPCRDQVGPYLDISGHEMSSPRYIILYQCQDCYKLFDAWESMKEHIVDTGHCRAYCVECGDYLPLIESSHVAPAKIRSDSKHPTHGDVSIHNSNNSAHDSNSTVPLSLHGIRGNTINQTGMQTRAGLGETHREGPPLAQLSSSLRKPVCNSSAAGMTQVEYMFHLRVHRNVIGFSASRETLERLVNQRDAEYAALIQPHRKKETSSDTSNTNNDDRNTSNSSRTNHNSVCTLSGSPSYLGNKAVVDVSSAEPSSGSDMSVFCYQCPGAPHSKPCLKAFRYYGDFVQHLISAGHGPAHTAQSLLMHDEDANEDNEEEEEDSSNENDNGITSSILDMINKSEDGRCGDYSSLIATTTRTMNSIPVLRHKNNSAHSCVHGSQRSSRSNNNNSIKYNSLFPMIDYRVRIKASVLCKYFGFVRCAFCADTFEPKHARLHGQLCVEYYKSKREGVTRSQR